MDGQDDVVKSPATNPEASSVNERSEKTTTTGAGGDSSNILSRAAHKIGEKLHLTGKHKKDGEAPGKDKVDDGLSETERNTLSEYKKYFKEKGGKDADFPQIEKLHHGAAIRIKAEDGKDSWPRFLSEGPSDEVKKLLDKKAAPVTNLEVPSLYPDKNVVGVKGDSTRVSAEIPTKATVQDDSMAKRNLEALAKAKEDANKSAERPDLSKFVDTSKIPYVYKDATSNEFGEMKTVDGKKVFIPHGVVERAKDGAYQDANHTMRHYAGSEAAGKVRQALADALPEELKKGSSADRVAWLDEKQAELEGKQAPKKQEPTEVPKKTEASKPGKTEPAKEGEKVEAGKGSHVVQKGETLSKIARQHFPGLNSLEIQRKVDEIFAANRDKIHNKNMIFAGQELKIPGVKAKAETKTDAKAEPKTEAKTETKTEAKAEPKTEAKAETKTETKAEHKPEAKVEKSNVADTINALKRGDLNGFIEKYDDTINAFRQAKDAKSEKEFADAVSKRMDAEKLTAETMKNYATSYKSRLDQGGAFGSGKADGYLGKDELETHKNHLATHSPASAMIVDKMLSKYDAIKEANKEHGPINNPNMSIKDIEEYASKSKTAQLLAKAFPDKASFEAVTRSKDTDPELNIFGAKIGGEHKLSMESLADMIDEIKNDIPSADKARRQDLQDRVYALKALFDNWSEITGLPVLGGFRGNIYSDKIQEFIKKYNA